jgi:DNA-directed RNA polymerase specialized sigma subunit
MDRPNQSTISERPSPEQIIREIAIETRAASLLTAPFSQDEFLSTASAFAHEPLAPGDRTEKALTNLSSFFARLIDDETYGVIGNPHNNPVSRPRVAYFRQRIGDVATQSGLIVIADDLIVPYYNAAEGSGKWGKPAQHAARLLLWASGMVDFGIQQKLVSKSNKYVLDTLRGSGDDYETLRDAVRAKLAILEELPIQATPVPISARAERHRRAASRPTESTNEVQRAQTPTIDPHSLTVPKEYNRHREQDRGAVKPQLIVLKQLIENITEEDPDLQAELEILTDELSIREAHLAIGTLLQIASNRNTDHRSETSFLIPWQATGRIAREVVARTNAPSNGMVYKRYEADTRMISRCVTAEELERVITNGGVLPDVLYSPTIASITEDALLDLVKTESHGGQVMLEAWRDQSREDRITAEEEVMLAQTLQKGIEADKALEESRIHEALSDRRLTAVASGEFTTEELGLNDDALTILLEIEELQSDSKAGKKAYEELVRCNQRLLHSIAKDFASPKNALLDETALVSVGNEVLCVIINDFDPDYGAKLSSFLYKRITQAVQAHIESVGISRGYQNVLRQINRAKARIASHTGNLEPSAEEIAADINQHRKAKRRTTAVTINNALEAQRAVENVSWETPVGNSESTSSNTTLGDAQADNTTTEDIEDLHTEMTKDQLTEKLIEILSFTEEGIRRARPQVQIDVTIAKMLFVDGSAVDKEIAGHYGWTEKQAKQRISNIEAKIRIPENAAALLRIIRGEE